MDGLCKMLININIYGKEMSKVFKLIVDRIFIYEKLVSELDIHVKKAKAIKIESEDSGPVDIETYEVTELVNKIDDGDEEDVNADPFSLDSSDIATPNTGEEWEVNEETAE